MRIAVIGAGVVGSGLVRVFLAAGHSVVISSRHADRAAKKSPRGSARRRCRTTRRR